MSHVDAIEKYNARLSSLLDKEKSKDDAMRTLEKQLYADKLKVCAPSGGGGSADSSVGFVRPGVGFQYRRRLKECTERLLLFLPPVSTRS